LWAELSEKLSDVIDPSLNYGGGASMYRGLLESASQSIHFIEGAESAIAERLEGNAPDRGQLLQLLEDSKEAKVSWNRALGEAISSLERIRLKRR
jgi:hypothetical protein